MLLSCEIRHFLCLYKLGSPHFMTINVYAIIDLRQTIYLIKSHCNGDMF